MSSLEEREHLPAIIHYLRRRGVHAQLWKANPTSQENHRSAPLAGGLFGVPLHSLPLSERAEGVPQFLVDACELLRPHLHIEGLFRKCGSLTRIKALKRRLEAGERCLEMALPCDVATLVKQFLRDLPEPLIPAPLQGPLCQTQQRGDLEEAEEAADQGSLALLLTCLMPPKSAAVLRYLFCFLQDVAARCTQNKMDLANLAIIFAPNLFSAEPCSQLGSRAEGQLQRQAAVVQVLISRASEIGTVPQILLEKVRVAFSDLDSEKGQPPPEPENPGGRDLEGRRRRRRSMGNIVTEALSKFKTGRALCTAPCPEIKGDALSNNTTLKTSFNSKRKASDDVAWTTELSAKKRRSVLDSADSDPFDGNGRDPPDEPGDLNPVQVPTTGTPVFSINDSTPVSDTRPDLPRAPSGKVQRRRSGGRKHSQRKHSVHTPPCCSPTSFERKNKGRKSLRIFSRGSKDLPLPTSPKAAEPSGWLLTKKKVAEAQGGLALQPRWAQPQSCEPRETEKGSPNGLSSRNAPPSTNPGIPNAVSKCKCAVGLSPPSDSFPNHLSLRRSLSWPEDLSTRKAAEERETGFFPDGAPLSPVEHEAPRPGPAGAPLPLANVVMAGVRSVTLPEVHVTLADGSVDGRLENGACDLPRGPLLSMTEASEAHLSPVGHLHEGPPSVLKRLTLHLQRLSSSWSSPPKRKGGRRFGRSVSHESGLPLQVGPEEAFAGQTGQPPKSCRPSFKAYGRQICVARKQIVMSFARKRDRQSPSDAEPSKVAFPENHH